MSANSRAKSALPGEFLLIARYFAPLSRGFPGAYGLLDDAAVITPRPGCELVLKTDAIVGGVDFPPATPAGLIARKALRINLSDLAAKGATPRAYMLDLMLPPSIDEGWIAAFAAGLSRDQSEYGLHLVGGDMSSTPGPVTIAVMAFGEMPAGQIIRRGGAQAGDAVYVTGTIGDAALGLAVQNGALPGLGTDAAAFLLDRYHLPCPRVQLGPSLIGIASAALDVSDGLVGDLRHICEVSNVAAVIEADRVPLSTSARSAVASNPRLFETALTGGDDYEILFTAPADKAGTVADLSRAAGVPITCIGHIRPADSEPAVSVLDEQGSPMLFVSESWTHF